MADNNGGGGTTVIALVLGGMLVLVVMIFAFGGFDGIRGPGDSVTIETPAPRDNVTILERDSKPDTNVTIFEQNKTETAPSGGDAK